MTHGCLEQDGVDNLDGTGNLAWVGNLGMARVRVLLTIQPRAHLPDPVVRSGLGFPP